MARYSNQRECIRAIYQEVDRIAPPAGRVNVEDLISRVTARGFPHEHVAARIEMMVRAAEMTEIAPGVVQWA